MSLAALERPRARMSAQVAATVIGRPRIEPESSIGKVTVVSRNAMSFSCLKDRGCCESMITRGERAVSKNAFFEIDFDERLSCLAHPAVAVPGFPCQSSDDRTEVPGPLVEVVDVSYLHLIRVTLFLRVPIISSKRVV